MENKTEIKKLVLSIGGKEQTITIEEAKKLYEALKELFEKSQQVFHPIYRDHYVERPYRWWEPIYMSRAKTTFKKNAGHAMMRMNTNTLRLSLAPDEEVVK